MSTPTVELGLLRAVDADDTADYLVTNLANSLVTVDSLFNNVSGHTHAGAHQGGAIGSGSVSGPYNWPDWIRSTGHTSAFATLGAGCELYYDSTTSANVQGYNRATAAYVPLHLNGSALVCNADGSSSAGGALTVAGTLTASGALTVGSTLSVAGGTTLTGALTANAGVTASALQVNGSAGITGNLTISGAASSGSFSTNNIALPDNGGITWIDGSTRLSTTSRAFYFDTYNVAFNFRNSATSLSVCASISPTGNLTMGGPTLQFSNNNAIFWSWNGSQLASSHSILNGGSAYYFAGNPAVFWNWTGTILQSSHPNTNTGYHNSTGQVCANNAYDSGNHGNCFLAPNNSGNGTALAFAWSTWSSLVHADQYSTRVEDVIDPLGKVSAINGYSYDHVQFDGASETPVQDDAGVVALPTYGFHPAEVAAVLPELVANDPDGNPAYIDLDRMLVILWEAFKENVAATNTRLDALEAA